MLCLNFRPRVLIAVVLGFWVVLGSRVQASSDSVLTVQHFQVSAESYRVAFFVPSAGGAFPLIIAQHGSSPTEAYGQCPLFGSRKNCVMTDVFTKELVRQATEEGFAVAVIDAFSELGVSSADKTRFPNATRYAVHLRGAIRSDPQFDQSRIYYTGFSYGGHSVMNILHDRAAPFKAIAPVEAGCQIQPVARLVPYGVLFVLGDRSHYPPKPCLYLQQALHAQGVDARAVVIAGANHNFGVGASKTGPSRSLNGCTDNHVIIDGPHWRHVDGKATNRKDAVEACTTLVGYSSNDIEKMSEAVSHVVKFFAQQK
jgi:dienelactone hydrolase